ncbi:DUF4366 domain-containing protein [Bengtsoniella intestinalis]|uniref:CD1107 family mobile element protein n=1 Tax=Bengtsoniella intestinalis TaxID=3073143 RepID=UPI00391F8EBF
MKITKWMITTLAVMVFAFSTSTVAFAGGSEDIEPVSEEVELIAEVNADAALTPDGNLTLVDDITVTDESSKQFITAVSKDGNYFYIVIDRSDDSENVYLLNLIDEADLVALTTGESVPLIPSEPTVEEPTPEPTPEVTEPEEPITEETDNNSVLLLVLVLGIGGIGGAYYFVFVKGKKGKKENVALAFDEDEDEYSLDDAFGEEETVNEDEDDYDPNDTEPV